MLVVPLFGTTAPRAQTPATVSQLDLRRLDSIVPLVTEAIERKKPSGRSGHGWARRQSGVSESHRQPSARAEGRGDDARYHLRPGVAHQGRRDDNQRDDARRRGARAAERPRRQLHSGVRALRQGGHHRASPADARVGAAAGRRSRGHVDRLRQGDRARDRGSAHRRGQRAVRLQRHQLLPPRRHRPAGERQAAR